MLSLSLHTASGYPLSHPLVYSLFIVFGVSTIAFYFVEEHWAEEPLIPMVLLKERTPAFVLTGFLLLTMSTFARVRFFFSHFATNHVLTHFRFTTAFHASSLPARRPRVQRI